MGIPLLGAYSSSIPLLADGVSPWGDMELSWLSTIPFFLNKKLVRETNRYGISTVTYRYNTDTGLNAILLRGRFNSDASIRYVMQKRALS